MKKKLITGCIIVLILAVAAAAIWGIYSGATKDEKGIYVDPARGKDTNSGLSARDAFKTIDRAMEEVRKQNMDMTEDITVFLRGGTYTLDDTIVFGPDDSGTNGFNVIYKAYKNEKPVISGGKKITGWTLYDEQKNIYEAKVDTDGFRQLYVNGKRAIRARNININNRYMGSPYKQVPFSANPFRILYEDVKGVKNIRGTEIVWVSHWSQPVSRIESVKQSGIYAEVTLRKEERETQDSLFHHPQPTMYYYLENNLDFLDEAGEWYFDRAKGS
ncbi:MAG TPA: hypothetical protein PLZ84_00505, partial [Clostridia bacterium]|nr:hypothetical protein [Clostridia bacterium]